ncbi:M61 family metallopeptidase [Hydrocarboniphaga sp.]|uniref:M61 family metallopeptidase n=1 Tax=Hydrocarboniphaga sp. TaxID=2033016 RepID=UPI003D15337F
MTPVVRFEVSFPDPRAHRFDVNCRIDGLRGAVTFRLPGWIRGSYLVRDFAKHILDLRATRGGAQQRIERLDKNRFRIGGEGEIGLSYGVNAFDESVRKAYLDTRRGFFNGSSLFYCAQGCEKARFEVRIAKPADAVCEGWKVATTLKAEDVDAAGFGLYSAPDYETLIDTPVEIAPYQRYDFDVDGVPHALVLSGRVELDAARVTADLARICHVEREMFGQQPVRGPGFEQYLFLTNVVAAGYGGLEHKSSTALICSRGDFPRVGKAELSREYRTFLGLCSHEYFHLWNVKRITAAAFLESDLQREAYTRDLWHYEGTTSYYDDLFLLRANVIDAVTYLDLLAEAATRLQRSPARTAHTLEDASFETWIKYYQPDENSLNASTNYYVKGALVSLCLDMTLRLKSSVTLDDVMRVLWQRYGSRDIGVPEGGLAAVAQEISGVDLAAFFDKALRSTEELPLAELFAEFGVGAVLRASTSAIDEGGRTASRNQGVWAGLRLKPGDSTIAAVLTDSPALRAGLSAGDQLIALDGLRVTAQNWTRRLDAIDAGVEVRVDYFRGEELMSTTLTPVAAPLDTWTFTLDEVDGDKLERRKAWLGV